MSFPLARLVDAPDPSARIRFDFNDDDASAPRRVLADGLSLGAPSLSGDPATGALYGDRNPTFTVEFEGEKADALASVSALSRELLRRDNWLMVQLADAMQPVWLRLWRSAPAPLSLDAVYVDEDTGGRTEVEDRWTLPLSLTADAFLLGARESTPTATLVNNPSGTNPMRLVLPAMRGDAPTPLRVTVRPQVSDGQAGGWLVGVVSVDDTGPGGGAPTGVPDDRVVDIGASDGWTVDAGSSSTVTDSAYIGGSCRELTLPSVSNALQLSGRLSPPLPPGRYRVELRCEMDPYLNGDDSLTPTQAAVRIAVDAAYAARWSPTVYLTTPTACAGLDIDPMPYQGWLNLGQVTVPFRAQVPVGVTTPVYDEYLSIQAWCPSGPTMPLRVDALKFIPVDGAAIRQVTMLDSLFEAQETDVIAPCYPLNIDKACTWDADTETVWETFFYDHTGSPAPGGLVLDGTPELSGGFPVADPAAAENLLVCFPTWRGRSDSSNASTAADASWTVDVSWQPRFLHLGDGR